MSMKIPSSIRVKGKRIEILWSENLDPTKTDETTLGEWRPSDYQIVLKSGRDPKSTFRTYLHELMHCVDDLFGMKLSHPSIYQYELVIWRILVILGFFKKEKKAKAKKAKK